MRPTLSLTLAVLLLAACTVDGSVIDDLPCECADGFVCDATTNRCVPGAARDASSADVFDSSAPDAATDVETTDVGTDVAAPDAGSDGGTDAGTPDVGGPDAGPVRDPALGDCLAGPADTFTTIDDVRWGSTDDGVGMQSIEDGVFVTRVPADNRSAYSFLSSRDRVDLRDCAVVVEMPAAQRGEAGVSFFSVRISNNMGQFSFGVERDMIEASYHDGSEGTSVWTADYDPEEHRWFAFRGDAGEMIWLLSADGVEWTEVHRVVAPIALDALQSLFGVGANRDNPTDVEARFDNYNNPPL